MKNDIIILPKDKRTPDNLRNIKYFVYVSFSVGGAWKLVGDFNDRETTNEFIESWLKPNMNADYKIVSEDTSIKYRLIEEKLKRITE